MKYIVMECHYSYAVLLDRNGRFVKAANLGYKVGQTVEDPVLIKVPSKKTVVFRAVFRALVFFLLLSLLVWGVHSCSSGGNRKEIDRDEAYHIALEHAGVSEEQVKSHSCELEEENGVRVYDVEFTTDTHMYEYDIDTENGKIISFEKLEK